MVRPARGTDHRFVRIGPPRGMRQKAIRLTESLHLKQHGMRRRNIIAAVALLALTAIYGVLTTQLPSRSLPDTPGPPFFPWINTVILFALSLGLLVQGLMGKTAETASAPSADDAADQRRRALWAFGIFIVYLLVLPGLGFLLATVPFFAALMVLFGERRWLWVTIGSVSMTVFLYILFRHGFSIFLPRGILPDLTAGIF